MENTQIKNHTELTLRIMHLRAQKFSQEEELHHAFKEFMYSITLTSIIKKSINNLKEDEELKFDIKKVGLNTGISFLIGKILSKNYNVKGFLGAALLEKIAALFINKNASKIISGISHFFSKKLKQDDNYNKDPASD